MSEDQKAPKRLGRPPKKAEDRKAENLTFRTRNGLRERLQASADARGLSLSEECERRLETSLDMAPSPAASIVVALISQKMKLLDTISGEQMTAESLRFYEQTAHNAVGEAFEDAMEFLIWRYSVKE